MAKKLFVMLLALTIVTFSSIPAYADDASDDSIIPSSGVGSETEGQVDTIIELTQAQIDAAAAKAAAEKAAAAKAAAGKLAAAKIAAAKAAAVAKAAKYKSGLARYIRHINKGISYDKSLKLAGYFIKYGKQYKMDEQIVMALAQTESHFNTSSHNPYGYWGLMQISTSLAKSKGYKGISLLQPNVNIKLGTRYLKTLSVRFHNDYFKGVAAYVYGSGSVQRGYYSKTRIKKIVDNKTAIKKFLKKYKYVS